LSLRGDFEFGLLDDVGIIDTMGSLGDRLNTFCLVKGT
jgi:hypothetical protein